MSKIVEIEYYTDDIDANTGGFSTSQILVAKPLFYILDNGMEIAEGCGCEECNMLRFSLITDSTERNEA